MYCYIDTTETTHTTLAVLTADGAVVQRARFAAGRRRGDVLFRRVCTVMPVGKITGIAAVTGRGRFSRSRQAVVVANAIGAAMRVPVIAVTAAADENEHDIIARATATLGIQHTFRPIVPTYAAPPSITMKQG